jgi:hypothetical protein
MSEQPFVQRSITIALPEHLQIELAEMARNAETSEGELVERAVEGLVQAHRGVGIPRFARRLGPIVLTQSPHRR